MGRIAQPAQLRVLKGRGNGKDSAGRLVTMPPPFERGAPEPPAELSDEGRAEWNRIVPGLAALDLLKPEDYSALVTHCENWANYWDALRQVRAEGIVITNPVTGHAHKHPAMAVVETMSSALRATWREFGLTPSAEQNVGKKLSDGRAEDDPFGSGETTSA